MRVGGPAVHSLSSATLGINCVEAYQLLNNNLVFKCAKPSLVTVEAFLWKDSCLFTQCIQADDQETHVDGFGTF